VNGRYGYIDLAGKEALPPVYAEAFPFSGGFATARLGDRYGFIARDTLAFKEKDYIAVGPYSEGLAHVQALRAEDRCGYIDKDGNELIGFDFTMCASFTGGLAPVIKEFKGGWGFIDKSGALVIPFKYDSVHGFKAGLAKVSLKDKTFYIDAKGFEYRKK